MQNQILVNGVWTDGDPTTDGEEYRIKIPVGNGFGYQQQQFRTGIPLTVRIISVDDFIDRIPRAAYETITNHASNEAKSFVSMLNARNAIPLDDDKTVYYVGKMLQAGLITQNEHDTILG